MFHLKTVLLPVDFSDRSLEAIRQARGVGRYVQYRLIILNVREARISELQFEPGGLSTSELQSHLDREFGETPAEYIAEPGDPAEIIARVARNDGADLILMAGHNRRPFEDFALDSVTAEVLDSASCPVWLSLHEEGGQPPLFRRILCPVGLSDSSGAALDWALGFADACHAACDVIHVHANSDGVIQQRIAEVGLTSGEREGLDAFKKKLDGRGQIVLAAGDLTSAIATAAADLKSDLLIMGRSRPGNEIARVRSLPFTLAHRAPCPVVVV